MYFINLYDLFKNNKIIDILFYNQYIYIYKFVMDWYDWTKNENVILRIGTIIELKEKRMEKVKNLSILFFPFMEPL